MNTRKCDFYFVSSPSNQKVKTKRLELSISRHFNLRVILPLADILLGLSIRQTVVNVL